jgi:four helix bundle protein
MVASMTVPKSFEDLAVFKLAYRLSLEIHRASLDFPAIEQRALAEQIRRASKSICANLAEGFGKQVASPPEFKRFLAMAIGSADEMRVVDPLLSGSGLHRPADLAALARHLSGGGADAARLASEGGSAACAF